MSPVLTPIFGEILVGPYGFSELKHHVGGATGCREPPEQRQKLIHGPLIMSRNQRGWKNFNLKRYVHLNVHCSTIYNSQDTEATWVSISRETDKEDVVCAYSVIQLSHKKKKNEGMPFAAAWMDLEMTLPSELSQRDRNTVYHLYLEPKVWPKWTYETETDLQTDRKEAYKPHGYQRGKEAGGERRIRSSRLADTNCYT